MRTRDPKTTAEARWTSSQDPAMQTTPTRKNMESKLAAEGGEVALERISAKRPQAPLPRNTSLLPTAYPSSPSSPTSPPAAMTTSSSQLPHIQPRPQTLTTYLSSLPLPARRLTNFCLSAAPIQTPQSVWPSK